MPQSILIGDTTYITTNAPIEMTDRVYNHKNKSWGYAMKKHEKHTLIIHEDYTESLVLDNNLSKLEFKRFNP